MHIIWRMGFWQHCKSHPDSTMWRYVLFHVIIGNTLIRTGSILWMICSNLIAESGYFWLSLAFLLITQSEVNDQLSVWILAMQQNDPTSVIQWEGGCLGSGERESKAKSRTVRMDKDRDGGRDGRQRARYAGVWAAALWCITDQMITQPQQTGYNFNKPNEEMREMMRKLLHSHVT